MKYKYTREEVAKIWNLKGNGAWTNGIKRDLLAKKDKPEKVTVEIPIKVVSYPEPKSTPKKIKEISPIKWNRMTPSTRENNLWQKQCEIIEVINHLTNNEDL